MAGNSPALARKGGSLRRWVAKNLFTYFYASTLYAETSVLHSLSSIPHLIRPSHTVALASSATRTDTLSLITTTLTRKRNFFRTTTHFKRVHN